MSIEVEPQRADTVARSQLYKYFSLVFSYPAQEMQWGTVTGTTPQMLEHALENLPYSLSLSDGAPSPQDYTLEDLQLSYTRLFEAGPGSSVISLNESEFVAIPQKDVWEDVIRFYEHFGLKYDGTITRQWPDHLVIELECLHYLSFLQAGMTCDLGPILRAQQDFAERHLLNWVPRLVDKLACVERNQPYAGQVGLLIEYLNAERKHLMDVLRESGELPIQSLASFRGSEDGAT